MFGARWRLTVEYVAKPPEGRSLHVRRSTEYASVSS
jgi:hypothetical protein